MLTEGGEEFLSTFQSGAAYDIDQESLGATPASGLYVDGRNVRPVSNQGNTHAAEKIRGEQILYANGTTFTTAVCVAAESINQHLVEAWFDVSTNTFIIRIDGTICLQSNFIFPTGEAIVNPNSVQVDKNESGTIAELFLTDNTVAPYIFNINDLIAKQAAGSVQYFSGFNPVLYQINLQSPLDRPVFVELKNVGLGLPVGQYRYQIQYANDEGDVTNWSMATDLIPVVEGLSSQSFAYPWCKTYGGPPAPSSPTAYAIHLRFRVTNIYNYQYINIKRLAYNEGAGINFTPNGVIVAKIPISPGEISVRDYFDPQQSNTTIALSEAQETQQIAEIKRAKAIRYFDRRTILMNVEVPSKLTAPKFLDISGKQGFPVIQKLGVSGHKDPYNHASYRSYMRGEVEGFGMVQFDGVGTPGFVDKIPQLENFTFPNRRDPISTETRNFSLHGTAKSATSAIYTVDNTHEVFDLDNVVAKQDYYSFKNIIRSGPIAGLTGTKTVNQVNHTVPSAETPGQIQTHGAHVLGLLVTGLVSVSYQPYHPVTQGDPNVSGLNFICTTGAYKDSNTLVNTAYNPPIFAPNYYAMGMCVAGFDNFAPWAKAFAVVKTPPKRKVICQGIGFYSMTPADYKSVGNNSLTTKDTKRVCFFSPDITHGLVSSDTVNDIISNPQNYQLQFVSPLGFASEIYNFETSTLNIFKDRDSTVDMISYIRMIRDKVGGQINPEENSNMGINGGDGYSYVTYEKYRNQSFSTGPHTFTSSPELGNTKFDIEDIERIAEGRGEYLSIGTFSDIYGEGSTGGSSNREFKDTQMQDWTEPMYIINIVRNGVDVIDQNILGYQQTTHYQKLSSIIGSSNGTLGQKFILVDERWEDCIPAPDPSLFGASDQRFITIKDPTTGVEQIWMNVTYMSSTVIAAIQADIISNGFFLATNGDHVTGMYTHEDATGQSRFFNIVFDVPGFAPPNGNYIIVNYDNTAPIRVFGGDTYISEAIFSPIDRVANSEKTTVSIGHAETQFPFGVGFPYHTYQMNTRQYLIHAAGSSVNVIQEATIPNNQGKLKLGYIRQMAAMFTCEVRCGLHYAYNGAYPDQQFPLIGYVIRPSRWKDTKDLHDNGVWTQYGHDYPNEMDNWEWGGFRTLPQVNADYSTLSPIQFFSRPEFGFIERTVFDTRIMWSLPRVIGVQDSPSLKTFPANNSFDIDDNQGEIKRAWDATTGKGENLYAFTNKGICLLITKKSILSDLTSSELGLMAVNSFIADQYWLSKDVGMFDEYWRSAAEAFVPITTEEGSEVRKQAIFFANNESVFRFMENECKDIGRIDYHVPINEALVQVLPKYRTGMTAIFDKFYQEYWLFFNFPQTESSVGLCFGQKTGRWYGKRDYRFDKYMTRQNETFGLRGLQTYTLDQGYIINGAPINFELVVAAAPEQKEGKEFMRIKINSPQGQKPTKVEYYYDKSFTLVAETDPTLGPLYLKDYNNYEQNIGRALASYNAARPRVQARSILYKIYHNLASAFKVFDSSIRYKKLK